MVSEKQAEKIIRKMVKLHHRGASISELLENFQEKDAEDSRLLSALRILEKEKDQLYPDKDAYHRLLQRVNVASGAGNRYFSREGVKGRKSNLLFNLNNFFMTFNPKVITAVSLVVVLGGVFTFWQLSPTFDKATVNKNQMEDVDLSGYAPATVVAVSDVDAVVDSIVDDSINEATIFDEEELDIYLADAEAESLSDLEQLYDAYEL